MDFMLGIFYYNSDNLVRGLQDNLSYFWLIIVFSTKKMFYSESLSTSYDHSFFIKKVVVSDRKLFVFYMFCAILTKYTSCWFSPHDLVSKFNTVNSIQSIQEDLL